MGGCVSGDVKGGKQAIGGALQRPTETPNNFLHNDAVDFFYRSHGLHALYTQIEVYIQTSIYTYP